MTNLNNEILEEIINDSFGLSIAAIWDGIREFLKAKEINVLSEKGVEDRKKVFIEILKKLLEEHRIKFCKLGRQEILFAPINEQIKLILDKWPPHNSQDIDDDLDDFGLWFFTKCPIGLIWISQSGSYIWTT